METISFWALVLVFFTGGGYVFWEDYKKKLGKPIAYVFLVVSAIFTTLSFYSVYQMSCLVYEYAYNRYDIATHQKAIFSAAKKVYASAAVTLDSIGIPNSESSIYFYSGNNDIMDMDVIRDWAAAIAGNPSQKFVLYLYSKGKPGENDLQISSNRLQAVLAALAIFDVKDTQVNWIDFGADSGSNLPDACGKNVDGSLFDGCVEIALNPSKIPEGYGLEGIVTQQMLSFGSTPVNSDGYYWGGMPKTSMGNLLDLGLGSGPDSSTPGQTPSPPSSNPATTGVAVDGAGYSGLEFGIGTEQDLVTNVGDRVFFAAGSSALSADAKATLDKEVDWLTQYPDTNVLVAGNADGTSNETDGLAIGQQHALAVQAYLVSKGIAASRIQTISYGKDCPIASGSDDASNQQDRNAIISVQGYNPQSCK